jgi:hypothetical protein
VAVPVTGSRATMAVQNGVRTDTFAGAEGRLAVTVVHADWPYTIGVRATGNGADGRGARGPIPLHLELDARSVTLEPGTPRTWTLRIAVE